MYKVIKDFTDLQDRCYKYHVGDEYPRAGALPTPKRIEQLKSSANRQGEPLITTVSSFESATPVQLVGLAGQEAPFPSEEAPKKPKRARKTKDK